MATTYNNYKVHFSGMRRRGWIHIIPVRATSPTAAIQKARERFAPGVKVYAVKIEEVS
jgi:1,2-phenylacetyl-CoA epoxidase PaaB subunit